MDVGALAERYGGVSARVVARAREFLRRMAALRAAASHELAAPAACLLVAAKALGEEPLDLKRVSALAGATPRLVELSMRKVLGVVDVRAVVQTSPAALCIRFGCEAISELVNRVYAEYQVVAERLSRGKGKGRVFDHREPVFAAACMFACSKHANLRVDKGKLLDAVCGNPKSFDAIVSSIETTCKASLSGAIISRRKRTGQASGSAAALADAADAALARRSDSRPEQSGGQSTGAPRTTPNKALRRVIEQSHGSRSSQDAALDNAAPPTHSIRRSVTGVTDDAYAAWRAQALAHMRARAADGGDPVVAAVEAPLTAQ